MCKNFKLLLDPEDICKGWTLMSFSQKSTTREREEEKHKMSEGEKEMKTHTQNFSNPCTLIISK